jgi:hypothetical protein
MTAITTSAASIAPVEAAASERIAAAFPTRRARREPYSRVARVSCGWATLCRASCGTGVAGRANRQSSSRRTSDLGSKRPAVIGAVGSGNSGRWVSGNYGRLSSRSPRLDGVKTRPPRGGAASRHVVVAGASSRWAPAPGLR